MTTQKSFTEEYRPGPGDPRSRKAATALAVRIRAAGVRRGRAGGAEAIHLALIATYPDERNHITRSSLNSVYASMSGMMTGSRGWLEPVGPHRGRNTPYKITDKGRSRVREIAMLIKAKEVAGPGPSTC